jgi:hypothetical protein
METKKLNLNNIDVLFNPAYGENKRLNSDEIKSMYSVLIEMLPEDNIEILTIVLLSLKDDFDYTRQILIEDSIADCTFIKKILTALREKSNHSQIFVFNNALNIEEEEYQQYFYEQLKSLKTVVQDIIKESIFKQDKNSIDANLNKTLAIIIQHLAKITKSISTKKNKDLFSEVNIKDTMVAICEMVAKASPATALPANRPQNDNETVHEVSIIDAGNKVQNAKNNREDFNNLATVVKESNNSLATSLEASFKKTLQHTIEQTVHQAVNRTIQQAVGQAVTIALEENNKVHFEKIEALGNIILSNNEAHQATHSKVTKHIDEQTIVLNRYRKKLDESKQ